MRRRETMDECLARLDAQAERLAVAPHVVYRAFDDRGVLLYIGCTVNLKSRMSCHRGGSIWHPHMATLEAEEFIGIEAARAAESAAINAEGTPFNSTPADIARTQGNRNEAKRQLANLGIYPPHYSLRLEDVDTFADSPEWADHLDESHAYDELVDELRAELKVTTHPYLTVEDRLAAYLDARAATEEVAA